MRSVLDDVAPHVLLITETNVPHRDNVSYFGDGTNEAQLVYNFALPPLVLHAIATGRADALTGWASALRLPSNEVTFFNFLASHDGIGINPVRGILPQADIDALVSRVEAHGGFISYKQNQDGSRSPYEMNINYFDALSDPNAPDPLERQVARFLVAHAIMLAMPGVPGIYFHSLFGSRGDRAGAETSGIPRRINREKLTLAALEGDLADPASLRSRVLAGFGGLLRQRGSRDAFHPGGRVEVVAADPRVFALRRCAPGGGSAVLCLHNVSDERVDTLDLDPYEVRWQQEER
jgi:sucrose phosphorylase